MSAITRDISIADLTGERFSKDTEITASEFIKVLDAMKVCENLKELYLTENSIINHVHPVNLFASLTNFQNLQVLNLSNCIYSTLSLAVVSNSLTFLTQLQELDLSHNWITENNFYYFLGEGLLHLNNLKYLDLSKNCLSENGNGYVLKWICAKFGNPSSQQCIVNLKHNGFESGNIDKWWDEVKEITGRTHLQITELFNNTINLGIKEFANSRDQCDSDEDSHSDSMETEE